MASRSRARSPVLERSLTRPDRKVEVVNGGTTGYSTDQEYLFYQQEGVRYAPRIVVLFFYYNDVHYNAHAGYRRPKLDKPVFLVDAGKLVLRNVPVPSPAPRGASAPPDDPTPAPSGLALTAWIQDRLRGGAPEAYAWGARAGLWREPRIEEVPQELKVYKRRDLAATRDSWERTALILQALAERVEADGARFLVAYVPSLMEVNDRAWTLTRLQYGLDDAQWDRRAVWNQLQRIAERRFAVLDLTPALRSADHGAWGGPYYPRDAHWNARGHEVAAREVEASLRGQGLLP